MQDHQESLALLSLRQASLLTDAVSVQVVHVAQTGAESGGSAFPSIQSTLGGQSSLSRCVMLHSDLSVIVWYTHASFCMQGYVQELYQPGLLKC